ncbi:hypothetical protein [Lentzea sp. HUAS12]|uniref:hypothetical protein n=1 Tax=Lentzea sp. HUAS12 TaxID=2951806 RepID=UPI00209E2511|nr:hypothetical protein [Lentzea sp. HUAS12]USX56407.1 hypothetical protein ND450_20590 [Lentzea sp. HUAS12]
MHASEGVPRSGFERECNALDAARSAFEWLVTGPRPVSVDGRLFPGLPGRRVPLNELRDLLLHRRCPQALRDAAWAHLVVLSRTEGGAWTVGAVGVALPALTSIAATLSARFAGDPSDIHSSVLAGFLAELPAVDLCRPRVMVRLRWAAYRAGHAAVREALDAPAPSGHGFRATTPAPSEGHPDFVLARAVAEGAITAVEAELIGRTRLEGLQLADVAAERHLSYEAAKKARQRAEHRLVAYLRDEAVDATHDGDVVSRAVDAVSITTAASLGHTSRTSRNVVGPSAAAAKKVRVPLSPQGRFSGVQGCGGRAVTPAHTTPPPAPSHQSTQDLSQHRPGPNPGDSRCA